MHSTRRRNELDDTKIASHPVAFVPRTVFFLLELLPPSPKWISFRSSWWTRGAAAKNRVDGLGEVKGNQQKRGHLAACRRSFGGHSLRVSELQEQNLLSVKVKLSRTRAGPQGDLWGPACSLTSCKKCSRRFQMGRIFNCRSSCEAKGLLS